MPDREDFEPSEEELFAYLMKAVAMGALCCVKARSKITGQHTLVLAAQCKGGIVPMARLADPETFTDLEPAGNAYIIHARMAPSPLETLLAAVRATAKPNAPTEPSIGFSAKKPGNC